MPSFRCHALRGTLALFVLGFSLSVFTAGTAHAATITETTWSETYVIEIGQDRHIIGTVILTRTDVIVPVGETPHDELRVEYSIAPDLDEWQLCVSDDPFTSRDLNSDCEKDAAPEDVGDFTIEINATGTVYVQFHFARDTDTGFIGWMPGNPFYGNVEIPDVPFTCTPDGDPMTDRDGNKVIDQADCAFVPPFTCTPDGDPMTDRDGNKVIDQADCTFVLPDAGTPQPGAPAPATPEAPAPVIPVDAPAPVTPEAPAAVIPVEAPVAPTVTPVIVDVLAETTVPSVAPAVTPATAPDTAVLGAQVQRTQLARTGAATPGLVALGALLLLMGAGMALVGRELATA